MLTLRRKNDLDQAVAEIIAGNQILDQARLLRLRNSDIKTELDWYKEAAQHFEKSLIVYHELFKDHGKIVRDHQVTRGDLSPRYRDAIDVAQNVTDERLYDGFKDVRVYYEMMSKWAESLIQASRLEVIGGQANLTLLEEIRNNLHRVKELLGKPKTGFDAQIRQLRSFQESTDVVSLKTDVLGYYFSLGGVTQCYPHPFPECRAEIEAILGDTGWNECASVGDGTLLDADFAFRAYLAASLVTQSGHYVEKWLTLSFDTVKPVPSGNLFLGPRLMKQDNGETCIASGGTYNDKIIEVGINVITGLSSAVSNTRARLTYAGRSYFRAWHHDGLSGDIKAALDRINSVATRFWDVSGANTLSYQPYKVVEMETNVISNGNEEQLARSTLAFKERSVAASNWELDLLQHNGFDRLFGLNEVNDIKLVMRHKYITRNIRTCNNPRVGSADSINLFNNTPGQESESVPLPFELLPEDAWFMEETLYRKSLE